MNIDMYIYKYIHSTNVDDFHVQIRMRQFDI